MGNTDNETLPEEPPQLRRLRLLVTTLMVTLILGMVIIVGLMVVKFGFSKPVATLPESISLPAGQVLTNVSVSRDWVILIAQDDGGAQFVHIVKSGTESIYQSITVNP